MDFSSIRRKVYQGAPILVGVLVMCAIGVAWYVFFMHINATSQYPLLISASKNVPGMQFGERIELESKLQDIATLAKKERKIDEYGIYFRDLNNGPIISINGDVDFAPASLLKLPVALWYFKREDAQPGFLDLQIEFTGPKGISIEQYPSKKTVVPGTVYTLRELIELMLEYSDNDATSVLTQYAGGREVINSVYADLGLQGVENYDTYTMDVHSYSALFRVLYNAEYLSKRSSEDLLEILTKTDFDFGIIAGLPEGVAVAHKFGERAQVRQLHDCGIVYAEKAPYLLCIMTRGTTYPEMATFIAQISGEVYNVVRGQ